MICDAARTYKCHLVTVVVVVEPQPSYVTSASRDMMAWQQPDEFLDTFVVIKVRGVQGPSQCSYSRDAAF